MSDTSFPAITTDHQRRLFHSAIREGYGAWAGVSVNHIEDGLAGISIKARPEMLTGWGTLNGGVITSLIEIPGFLTVLPSISDGELPVTNDIFVQHMRPLPGDLVYTLEGRLIKRSRTMAWADVMVFAGETLVTTARITKTIVRNAI